MFGSKYKLGALSGTCASTRRKSHVGYKFVAASPCALAPASVSDNHLPAAPFGPASKVPVCKICWYSASLTARKAVVNPSGGAVGALSGGSETGELSNGRM